MQPYTTGVRHNGEATPPKRHHLFIVPIVFTSSKALPTRPSDTCAHYFRAHHAASKGSKRQPFQSQIAAAENAKKQEKSRVSKEQRKKTSRRQRWRGRGVRLACSPTRPSDARSNALWLPARIVFGQQHCRHTARS